jgi:hypothetical protein
MGRGRQTGEEEWNLSRMNVGKLQQDCQGERIFDACEESLL